MVYNYKFLRMNLWWMYLQRYLHFLVGFYTSTYNWVGHFLEEKSSGLVVFWCSLTTCFATKWYVSPMSNGMLTENVDCMNCMLLNVTFRTFFRSKHMRIWLLWPTMGFQSTQKKEYHPRSDDSRSSLSLKQYHRNNIIETITLSNYRR